MAVEQESQVATKLDGKGKIIFTSTVKKLIISAIAFISGIILFVVLSRVFFPVNSKPSVVKNQSFRVAVTALGKVEPKGEVFQLSAPSSLSGVRVEKILVEEGDKVKAGQIVAWLENYARRNAALKQAINQVEIAKAKLAQVKAGAKQADINAQKAAIANLTAQLKGEIATQQAKVSRLKAELKTAEAENNRYQKLYKEGAVTESLADSKALEYQQAKQQLREAKANLDRTVNTLQDQIKEAQARLESIKKIRPTDIELAQADLKSAQTAVKEAQADYDLTYLKAPVNGTVLKIHAKSGEVTNAEGILEIGKISQMYVVAEVYQTDIDLVEVGQQATISSSAFSGKVNGTVSKIGLKVDQQNILSVDPTADTNHRVIPVKIRVNSSEDSQKLSKLTNLQVDVAIKIAAEREVQSHKIQSNP
ncbi:MAG: ABC exporter membrane fusion protein [Cyanobacteria bacterium P01_A01_bin.45]